MVHLNRLYGTAENAEQFASNVGSASLKEMVQGEHSMPPATTTTARRISIHLNVRIPTAFYAAFYENSPWAQVSVLSNLFIFISYDFILAFAFLTTSSGSQWFSQFHCQSSRFLRCLLDVCHVSLQAAAVPSLWEGELYFLELRDGIGRVSSSLWKQMKMRLNFKKQN